MELLQPPQELLPRGHPLAGGGLQDIEDILGQYQRMQGRLQLRGITPPPEKKPPTMWERISDIFEREEAMTANVVAALLRGEADFGKLIEEARLGLAGKKKESYGEILGDLGVKGPAKFIGGLALGMATAPSTYGIFGKILSKLAPVGRGLKIGAKAFPITRPLIEGGEELAKIGIGMFSHSESVRSVTQRLVREAEEKVLAEGPGPIFKYVLKGIGDSPKIRGAKAYNLWLKQTPALQRALIDTGAIGIPARLFEGMEVSGRIAIDTALEKKAIKKYAKGTVEGAKSFVDLLTGKILPKPEFLDGLGIVARGDPEGFLRKTVKLLKPIAEKRGFIEHGLPNYAAHYLTPEATAAMADTFHPAFTRIKRAYEVTKNLPRTYKKGKKFLGTVLKSGTKSEINKISMKELGFKMFEEDPLVWFPRYLGRFISQYTLDDAVKNLPTRINLAAGEDVFRKVGRKAIEKRKAIAEGLVPIPKYRALSGYWTLPEITKGLDVMRETFTSKEGFNRFLQLYDKYLGVFKYSVVAWPGTQAINMSGGFFGNFMDGLISPVPYFKTAKYMKNLDDPLLKSVKGTTKKLSTLDTEIMVKGGYFGLVRADIAEEAMKRAGALPKKKGILQTAWRAPGKVIENIEKSLRLPLAIDVWQKTGSVDEAYKAIVRVHFNYAPEALTAFEKNVMKRVIPFYSWSRNNFQLQLKNFFEKTPKYAAIFRGTRLLTSDRDIEAGRVPEWLREEIAFKVPKDALRLFGVKIPKDMYLRINTPLTEAVKMSPRQIASAVNPFIRAPIEWFFNKQIYSGRNIFDPDLPEEYRKMRVPAYLRGLPSPIKNWLGFQKTKRKLVTGRTEEYYEADVLPTFVFKSLLGPFSRLYWEAGKAEQMVDDTESIPFALMNFASPFRFHTVVPEEQEYYSLRKQKDQLQAITSYLMRRGIIPPAREDPAYQNWLKQQKLITLP